MPDYLACLAVYQKALDAMVAKSRVCVPTNVVANDRVPTNVVVVPTDGLSAVTKNPSGVETIVYVLVGEFSLV